MLPFPSPDAVSAIMAVRPLFKSCANVKASPLVKMAPHGLPTNEREAPLVGFPTAPMPAVGKLLVLAHKNATFTLPGATTALPAGVVKSSHTNRWPAVKIKYP